MDRCFKKLTDAIQSVRPELYAYHWKGSGYYSTGDGRAYTMAELRKIAAGSDLVLFEIGYRDKSRSVDWDSN